MTADLITRLCRSTESTAPVDCAIQVENSSLRAILTDEQIIRLCAGALNFAPATCALSQRYQVPESPL